MFEPSERPRLFGCAPGVDFPRALVDGLQDRTRGAEPHVLARVTILVNTQRMARRLRDLFAAGPSQLLPRVGLLTQLDAWVPGAPLPPATPPLRRLLELEPLVAKLIEQERDLNTRSASFDLARSLAQLMDEMQGEGVSAEDILALDVSDQSGHWARAKVLWHCANLYRRHPRRAGPRSAATRNGTADRGALGPTPAARPDPRGRVHRLPRYHANADGRRRQAAARCFDPARF